jgi:type II secretory pathway component PulJ
MESQDTKFNYKIILAALLAVILAILIAFYYSYAQSKTQIDFLEQEKAILIKDLTIMKADVDRLSALNEVNDIELQDSKFKVQQLLDSVGKLNFTVDRLREFKTELSRLEAKNDSLKLKNNFLRYNNMLLTDKYEDTRKQLEELQASSNSLAQAEALQRRKLLELNESLKTKVYLNLVDPAADAFRLRGGRPIKTNKASTIEKLRGCVTIAAKTEEGNKVKVLYLQFLDPNKQIIEDNANTITVNGNIYSKRVEVLFTGEDTPICDFITIPEGSLEEGTYTLNIFEDERLLATSEFQLK